ncbi:hypothetical protein D3C75_1386190 [compost metagenome]
MGIEADQGDVGQAQAALLAGGGALIGQPVTHRLIGADPAQQANHQHQAGDATANLAYTLTQAGA